MTNIKSGSLLNLFNWVIDYRKDKLLFFPFRLSFNGFASSATIFSIVLINAGMFVSLCIFNWSILTLKAKYVLCMCTVCVCWFFTPSSSLLSVGLSDVITQLCLLKAFVFVFLVFSDHCLILMWSKAERKANIETTEKRNSERESMKRDCEDWTDVVKIRERERLLSQCYRRSQMSQCLSY